MGSIQVNTMKLIVYTKGPQNKFPNVDVILSLNMVIALANSAHPDKVFHLLFAQDPLYMFQVYKGSRQTITQIRPGPKVIKLFSC